MISANGDCVLRDEERECSKTVIPRRNDEESAFPALGFVLKSRFLASFEMTLAVGFGVFEHSRLTSRRDLTNYGLLRDEELIALPGAS